jgi:hypothetical protein
MPAAAPVLISAIASAAASAAVSTALGAFASTLVGTLIVNAAGALASFAVSSLLSPKAKAQKVGGATNPQLPFVESGVKTNNRNNVEFREIVYGEARKGGLIVFEKTTSSGLNNNGVRRTGRDVFLHQVIAFASHQCESFEEIYIDGNEVTLDADGFVTNAQYTKNSDTVAPKGFTGFAAGGYIPTNATGLGTAVSYYLDISFATASATFGAGELIQVAGFSDGRYNGKFVINSIATHAAGVATRVNVTVDSAVVLTSVSSSGVTFDIRPINYKNGVAYGFDSSNHDLISGDRVFIYGASPDEYNQDKIVVQKVSDKTFTYPVSGVTTFSLSGTFQRRNGNDEALVNIQKFLGSNTQDFYSNPRVQALAPDLFVPTDKFQGITLIYARLYDSGQFSQAPQITVKLKGKNNIYDPRDGSVGYNNNAACVVMDYLHSKIGVDNQVPIGFGLQYDTSTNTSDDINIDSFADFAQVSDEQVLLRDGTWQPRYTINGVISLGEQPVDVLSLMTSAFQGTITEQDFKVVAYPAVYTPAIHYIDETWLMGSFDTVIDSDKQSLVNTIRPVFNDEEQKYYPDDAPKFQDATALAEDQNEELTEDLQLPFVTNIERAQRLSKLYLQQRRRRESISVPLNIKGSLIAVHDTISFNYNRFNWSNRLYKVIGHSEGLLNEGVSVTLRSESASIYEWDASEAST